MNHSPAPSYRGMLPLLLVLLLGLALVPVSIQAAEPAVDGVRINEVMPVPMDPLVGTSWVELFNPSDEIVDVGNLRLTNWDELETYLLPAGTLMAPGSYLVLSQNSTRMLDLHGISSLETGLTLTEQDGLALGDGSLLELDVLVWGALDWVGESWNSLERVPISAGMSIARYDLLYQDAFSYIDPIPTPGAPNGFLSAPATLTLAPTKNLFVQGVNITFDIGLHNLHDAPIKLASLPPGASSVILELVLPNGSVAALGEGLPDYRSATVLLDVGEEQLATFDASSIDLQALAVFADGISYLPDRSIPGTYSARLHYTSCGIDADWCSTLSSDVVQFKVSEDPATSLLLDLSLSKDIIDPGEETIINVNLTNTASVPMDLLNLTDQSLELVVERDDGAIFTGMWALAPDALQKPSPSQPGSIPVQSLSGGSIVAQASLWDIRFQDGDPFTDASGRYYSGDFSINARYHTRTINTTYPVDWTGIISSQAIILEVLDYFDLSVMSINVSNPTPTVGENITIWFDVLNTGTLSSQVEAEVVVGDTLELASLVGKSTELLEPSETLRFSFRWECQAGPASFWARVSSLEGEDMHPENAHGFLPLVVSEDRPDLDLYLTPDDILFSTSTPNEGEDVAIYAVIRNNGLNPGLARVQFFDGDPNSGGVSIGYSDEQSVGVGESAVASIFWNAIGNGAHDIHAIITAINGTDQHLLNDHAFASLIVGSSLAPRLILTLEAVDLLSIIPGDEIRVNLNVRSLQLVEDTIHLEIMDTAGLVIQHLPLSQSVEPGQSVMFTLLLTLPENGAIMDRDDIALLIVRARGTTQAGSNSVPIPFRALPVSQGNVATTTSMDIIMTGGAVVGFGTLGALALLGFATDFGKYRMIALLWIPLYTRINDTEIFDNFTRGKIYGSITTYPGIHYSSLRQILDLRAGTLTYHLKVLEREGFVKGSRDGKYLRFYPTKRELTKDSAKRIHSMSIPEKAADPQSRIQQSIFAAVKEDPGLTQKEIGDKLGESKQLINYHVKLLEGAGLVRMERKGRRTLCYAETHRRIKCPRCSGTSDVAIPQDSSLKVSCPHCGVDGIVSQSE